MHTLPWRLPFDPDLLRLAETLSHAALLETFSAHAQQHGLFTGLGRPLYFVPQEDLPQGIAYESFIAQTGAVPTRDNLHDRYNALIWLCAPHTKAALNRIQSTAILQQQAAPSQESKRGSVRDAATLWDENLAVLVVNDSDQSQQINNLLHAHDWHALFITHRHHWNNQWQLVVFGHALMEKLHQPFKSITAHVLVASLPQWCWSGLDHWLADFLDQEANPLSTSIFRPLPVMGIPGWAVENEDPRFYEDTRVFRPRSTPQRVS
jgi:hypothetical protein